MSVPTRDPSRRSSIEEIVWPVSGMAVAATARFPLTIAPSIGAVMVTDGALGRGAVTVKVRPVENNLT